MGIDYGSKRVGIALSDSGGQMAFPHSVLVNDTQLLDAITTICNDKEVGAIVVGQSIDKDGNPNVIQSSVESLVQDLTLAVGVPIHLEPEQYTTQAATRIQGRNEQTDAAAAALILEGFLMKQRSHEDRNN